jgi:penicillin-binding protein 1C
MMRRRFNSASIVVTLTCLLMASDLALTLAPIPPALLRPPVQSITLLDRNGLPLRETRVAERFSRELALDEVPPHVIDAILAAEDKRFYSHHGIDWLATGRAAFAGLSHGRIVSGASTITQQLVKISQRRPRTFRAKIIESVTALHLEQSWSKKQILAAYLNRLDFGNLNIGLAAAADYYFGKPVADLSDAEAAFLAGLPRNPRKLNPHVAPDAVRGRQITVLDRMQANHRLDAARYEHAIAEPITLRPPQRRFRAPHFVEMVLHSVAGIADPGLKDTNANIRPGSTIPATTESGPVLGSMRWRK